MEKSKLIIQVFITKNCKFRARYKEPGNKFYTEVTVGSESWELGKGRQYEEIIRLKCSNILSSLTEQLNNLSHE